MYSWKMLLPFVLALLIVVAGLWVPLEPIVGTEDRVVRYQFNEPVGFACEQQPEVRAIRFIADGKRMQNLQHAVRYLHDHSLDPWWQPLLEVLQPRQLLLDVDTFAITSDPSHAISINRYTRRLDFELPSASWTVKLSYRIHLKSVGSADPVVDVSSDQVSQGPTAVLQLLSPPDAVHLDHAHISGCAAAALKRYFTHSPWLLGSTSEAGYCRMHSGSFISQRFYYPCSQGSAAAGLAQ